MDKIDLSKGVFKSPPWLTIGLALLCLGLYLVAPYGSAGFELLQLRQSHPEQAWSLVTGNLHHSDWNHLGWNVAVLLVLGFWLERYSRWLWFCSVLTGFTAIDVWFYCQAHFTHYVGLSGSLNTLLVCGLYCLRLPGHWWRGNQTLWLVLILALAKNVAELWLGSALFSNTRFETTPGAHLAGMAAGIFLVVGWHFGVEKR